MNPNDAAIVAEELFVCDDPNYIVVFQLLDFGKDVDLSVHVHLSPPPPFGIMNYYDPQDFATFTGLWDSIKYVFRGGAGHGYYPVKHTDVDRMIAILERYQKVHEKLTASEEESAVGDWESEGGAVS